MNPKSDKLAKEQFKQLLESQGYKDVEIVSTPCDIIAWKDGVKHYFELKVTSQKITYFGAASETEWAQAFETPNEFRFVIAQYVGNDKYAFDRMYSPEEFLKYSSIPPFKIYFTINLLDDKKLVSKTKSTKIEMNKEVFEKIKKIFDEERNRNN